ncbi:MAG: SUMF1/EgtB/PvdO family nonheme iron enzyme [Planctomycetota bacterium]
MTTDPEDRWELLQGWFREAANLAPEEREAFIARECPDPKLGAEVLALLRSSAQSGVLANRDDDETRTSFGAPQGPAGHLPAGASIGPYEVIELIGEGGMGSVYRAQQTAPVRREVALKLVRAGLDTREILARFHAEQQVLAVMNHPCVAQVLDAGTTSDHRPYFVMEYVRGLPITDYCDRHKLQLSDRLRLFVQVCEGVHHAHQKGVIHRDLKPSNILVTQQGQRAVPKIIDFGVAKATSPEFMPSPLHTLHGQLIGTPEYMSPEQANPTAMDIDTRADIYSLGVLLYVLIVGEHPYAGERWRKALFGELQQIICETATPRPSHRLGSLAAETRRTFAARNEEVGTLVRRVRGELDWITMKALEKDRDRRYSAASELAADIERYFRNEPVIAGPPSAAYRVRKLIRRHRRAITTAVIAGSTLAASIGVSAYLYLESNVLAIARRGIDLQRVELLAERAATLWPADPARIPDLEEWLRDAKLVTDRLPEYRRDLDRLRELAHPYTDDDREIDRSHHTQATLPTAARAELADLRALTPEAALPLARRMERELSLALDYDPETLASASLASPLDRIEERLRRLDDEIAQRRTWRFDEADLQTRHDWLARLVTRIESLEGTALSPGPRSTVESRLGFARSVDERSLTGPVARDRWRAAIESIHALPAYGGLELTPQRGLLPLRLDPRSGLWEFWHLESGEEPRLDPEAGGNGNWQLTAATGLVFVLLPSGKFAMGAVRPDAERPLGSPNVDPSANPNEQPVRPIAVAAFFVSKYEMTQAQWLRVTGRNPSNYAADRVLAGRQHSVLHPVENISQEESEHVLARLGLMLPTEAQWEYAARAGTTTVWSTGDDKTTLAGYANLSDSTVARSSGVTSRFEDWLDDGYGAHAPVGSFLPNAFGLHDVHGNVWEFTRGPLRYYDKTRVRVEDLQYCVMRGGGCYFEPAEATRCANRAIIRRDDPDFAWGVRPVRELDP